jgi:predicted nucleic acid-binding protein
MARKNAIVFDSGPIINLAINNLLWILEELKASCNVEFFITPAVYDELIRKPLSTKKYKLEALQVLPHITNGTLKVYKHPEIMRLAEELDYYANNSFQIRKQWVKIVHAGELEALATAIFLQADAIGIDERTMRHLIEKPEKIAEHMEHRIHADVLIDWKNLNAIKKKVKDVRVIRSAELVTIAYEKGILAPYTKSRVKNIPNIKSSVLEGALWAVKLNGCSMKEQEIKQILKMEKK